jgi:predicted branched-subunit amino acid permease
MSEQAQETRRIVRDSLAVSVATGAYGVSFGAIGVTSGLDVLQTCALSLLVFTGASQFAFVGVVGAGGAPLLGAASGLLLGVRNALYGLRLGPLLGWRGARRAAAAHLVIDESTAMSVTRDSRAAARVGFLTTGVGVFVLWNLATLVGALAGNALGDPRAYGLDAAVGGAFLALLWPRLADRRNRVVAALAAVLATALVPVAPAGVPVLAAAVVALASGVRPGRPGAEGDA